MSEPGESSTMASGSRQRSRSNTHLGNSATANEADVDPDIDEEFLKGLGELLRKATESQDQNPQIGGVTPSAIAEVLKNVTLQNRGLPKCYMPDVDCGHLLRHIDAPFHSTLALSPRYRGEKIMEQCGYLFDGTRTAKRDLTTQDLESWNEIDADIASDIEVYSLQIRLDHLIEFRDFANIRSFLGLAPCLRWQFIYQSHYGLGRRFVPGNGGNQRSSKGKAKANDIGEDRGSYHIWILLPLPQMNTDEWADQAARNGNPRLNRILGDFGVQNAHLQMLRFSYEDRFPCFYLRFDVATRRTRIFTFLSRLGDDIMNELCHRGCESDSGYDPFIFVSGAISEFLTTWVIVSEKYFMKVQETGEMVISLGESFDKTGPPSSREEREREVENLKRARKLMLELHELRSYQVRMDLNFGYLSSIIKDSLEEHHALREFLDIDRPAYLSVERNLCTLASWIQSMKHNLESAQKRTDSCLSTLSLLLNMKNNYSVEENTRSLAVLTERSREENSQLKDIAEATQKDSEAMKTIALMTMLYLPANFVAALLSMGVINFDFQTGKNGTISLSQYWWIYLVLTIPLTVCTFLFFWLMQRGRESESKATESRDTAE